MIIQKHLEELDTELARQKQLGEATRKKKENDDMAHQLVELEEENRELRKQIESLQTELKLLRESLDENHEHTTKRD